MANQISKKEYLKRYLENDKDSIRKQKKKTKSKANVSRLKIINEDIDLKSIDFGNKVEEVDEDDAPVIAEVIDERPVEVKLKELYEPSRWKKINEISQSSSAILSDDSHSKFDVESASIGQTSLKKARHDSDGDISPPRRQENNSSRRHDSDNDVSPLRNQKQPKYSVRQDSDRDISPPRRQKRNNSRRHDSDNDDISPLKNQKHNLSKDISSASRHKQHKYSARQDSDGDISPPRKQDRNNRRKREFDDVTSLRNKSQHSDSDISPPRSKYSAKHDSDSDISHSYHHVSYKPSCQTKKRSKRQIGSDSDISSHHKIAKSSVKDSSKRQNSDSDMSPPRHKTVYKLNTPISISSKGHDSDSDFSPPRNKVNKSNTHLKNSSGRYDSDSDKKYPRHQSSRMFNYNKNKSGSQRSSDSDISLPRSSLESSNIKDKEEKLSRTLSGLKAGLQNSKTLQQEVQTLRKSEKINLNMLDDEISGRNADTVIRDRKTGMKRDLNKEQEAKAEETEKTKKYQQKYSRWGKGIEQAEDKVEKFKDDLYEMSKPLARYCDDVDLDKRLKEAIRDEDPMSEYIKKKRKKDTPNVPVYSGPPAPPNRFNILPGYRWDGVDRSNGFEKKYFEKINSTKAIQDEAYLWSVQDM